MSNNNLPIKEYFETLLVERDKRYEQKFSDTKVAVEAALIAAEKAVSKAELATEKRFEGVNEFRKSLDDLSRLQMPRAESEALNREINGKIEALITRLDKSEGKSTGISASWGFLLGGLGVVSTIIGIYLALK